MSLTIRQIYENTKNTYHLSMLEGHEGIDNIMNWVYVTEDITTTDFLKGGELIVTTGMHCQNENDLYEFIQTMIHADSCGLILNTGRYIQEENISERILLLCKEYSFPLITMPWRIHIYDITRDYYNRIFLDQQTTDCISDAFLSYIRKDMDLETAKNTLENYGYQIKSHYCVSILHCYDQIIDEDLKQRLLYRITRYLKTISPDIYITFYQNHFLFITHVDTLKLFYTVMKQLLSHLQAYHQKLHLHIGIGTIVEHLSSLHISYERALAALTMAKKQEEDIYSFEDIGFYQLLHSTHDKHLLQTYEDKYIGLIRSYDEEHQTNYLETLKEFILCDGSIQEVASHLFCHRNTISYRINVIKETWNLDLSDTETKFQLMIAFYIQDYLTLLT